MAHSHHSAQVAWQRGAGEAFVDNRYSRRHTVRFDGGAQLAASSSPHVVPAPLSDPSAVDPEEMFVAALSSCHMLWFLSIAAQRGHCVESYLDDAIGTMSRDEGGRLAITDVLLRPRVEFGAEGQPDEAALEAMHHSAHEACYLAHSVRCTVRCEPVMP